jgi:outer membrane lipoprotein SlyB
MTDTLIAPGQVTGAAPNRMLWAAVGLLGATTVALGAALWNKQPTAPSEPIVVAQAQVQPPAVSASAVAAPAPPVEEIVASTPKKPAAPAKSASEAMKNVVIPVPKVPFKEVPAPVQVTPAPAAAAPATAPKPVIVESSQPTVAPAPAPAPVAVAVPVCANCGTVESVTPFQREADASGVGAAAGAVIGGVLGNQVGGGNGKTLATILGAVGGGWAGNTVEKKMKQVTHYRVQVRMEDGSLRTVEQSAAIGVGERVTVDGATLRPAAPIPTSMTGGLRSAV